MLIKAVFVLSLLVSASACSQVDGKANSGMQFSKYAGEKMLEAKVVNRWQAGSDIVIQVQTILGGYLEIKSYYFGSIDPKVGDCVLVWASVYSGGHPIYNGEDFHNDRNIASCEN